MKRIDDIKEYLHGNRKGKAANRMEREALSDPFLYEALEGLASENQFIHGRDGKSILEGGCSRAERKAARSLYLICAVTGKSLLMIFGK